MRRCGSVPYVLLATATSAASCAAAPRAAPGADHGAADHGTAVHVESVAHGRSETDAVAPALLEPAGPETQPADEPAPGSDAAIAGDTALAEAGRAVLRMAPLAVPRLNYFHSSLEVPPMDTASTLPCGTVYLRARSSHARSDHEGEQDGINNSFDGTFHEWLALETTWAAAEDLELGARAVLAGWDEHQDHFDLFDDQGVPIVSDETTLTTGESSSRHLNLSVLGVRLKRRLVRREDKGFDLALAPSVKIPFGKDRDLTHAGTWDPALTVLATFPTSWGAVHANLGGTWPIGDQNLFEPEADVDLDPFLHAGIGAVLPIASKWSFAAQLEGNTSAFSDVPFLDHAPITFDFGLRWTSDCMVFEIAAGTGLDWEAAYQLLLHVGVGWRF